MIRYSKLLTIITLMVINAQVIAALPTAPTAPAQIKEELKEKYKRWLKSAKLNEDQVSFSLINLESLQTKDSYNERSPFIPASITKVFTTYFALSMFGSDHSFKTDLYHDGRIEDGTLKGNLYLYGGADPILTHAKLFNLVLSLRNKGIKKVEGKLYFDDSYIDGVKMISIIGLGDQTYNPSVSALSSEFNRFAIWRDKSSRSYIPIPTLDSMLISKTSERFDPGREYKYIEPVSLPPANTSEEQVIFGDNVNRPQMEHWQLSSRQNYKTRQELPIRRPSLFTASTFRFLANKIGIQLSYPERKQLPKDIKLIETISSPPLHEIVRLTLEYSNNYMAETLLLTSVKKLTGKSFGLKESARRMQIWLKEKFPTIKWDDIYLINGSGLTSANTVNAHELTHFFAKTRDDVFQGVHYWSLLSIAGKTGWMKKRFPSPTLSYNIWAKTGSLDYVNNISGYIFTEKGNSYSFSIFINDLDKRKIVDGDNSNTVNRYRLKAPAWKRVSNSFHKELLTHWIKTY